MGRVGLQVEDLDRVAMFYTDVIGLSAIDHDDDIVVLGAGGRPLVTLLDDPEAPERDPAAAGLFHVALRVPTRSIPMGSRFGFDRSDRLVAVPTRKRYRQSQSRRNALAVDRATLSGSGRPPSGM